MKRAATLLTAACLAALALPHPAAAQDLATAIADARAHSPALEAAAADADAAAARLAQARAAAGPTASVEGSVGTGRLDPGGYFGLTAQNVTPSAVQLVGEYPLYAGGRISAAIDQAAAGSRAATLGKDMARQNLTLATVGAYAEVLTARDLVASYGKLVDALGEIVRHTGLRYDVGDATSSEVAQAKARRAEGQAGLVQAQGRLTAALARLERLTGKPVGDLAPCPRAPRFPRRLAKRSRPPSPRMSCSRRPMPASTAPPRGYAPPRRPTARSSASLPRARGSATNFSPTIAPIASPSGCAGAGPSSTAARAARASARRNRNSRPAKRGCVRRATTSPRR